MVNEMVHEKDHHQEESGDAPCEVHRPEGVVRTVECRTVPAHCHCVGCCSAPVEVGCWC